MNSFIFRIVLICSFLFSNDATTQECYYPPSNSTLYTSTNPNYSLPSVTGLVTFDVLLSGEWQLTSATGAVKAVFLDNSGRTSTLQLSGEGSVTIQNTQTDLSREPNIVTQCTQTFRVTNYRSEIFINPPLETLCPVNVVVVIDESGSIEDTDLAQSIRNGVLRFGNLLTNSGSTMAIVEYDSQAARVSINGTTELQLVDAEFLSGLEGYLENDYTPTINELNLIGGTNWQDALNKANEIVGAEFILMLTDGNPTFYSVGSAMMGSIAGEGERFDLTALKHAQIAANNIKSSGKHLFVIGVDIPLTVQSLIDITGGNDYKLGEESELFFTADYVSVSSDNIEEVFTEIGINTCGVLVPTVGEWGVINLGLLLLIIGIVSVKDVQRRKSISKQSPYPS